MQPELNGASLFSTYTGRAQACSVQNLCLPAPQVETLQPEGDSVWEAGGNGSSEGRVLIHNQQADLLLGLPTALSAPVEVRRENKAAQGKTCAAQHLQYCAAAFCTVGRIHIVSTFYISVPCFSACWCSPAMNCRSAPQVPSSKHHLVCRAGGLCIRQPLEQPLLPGPALLTCNAGASPRCCRRCFYTETGPGRGSSARHLQVLWAAAGIALCSAGACCSARSGQHHRSSRPQQRSSGGRRQL